VIILALGVLYSFILFEFLGGNSFILVFFYLELLSWIFTLMMPTFISMKYLIIQAYFMILSLMGLLWFPVLLILRFFLKIGLPPIHIWFIKLTFFIKKWIFLVFSTVHKLFPLILLGSLFIRRSYFLWVLLLIGGRLIFQVFDFFFILLAYSIIHRSWTLLAIQFNLKLRLTYWVLYSLVFSVFLSTVHFFLLFKRSVEQSRSTAIVWLILSGLPPFVIFWLKMWIFLWLTQVRERLSLIVIIISILALTSYFRAFHTSLRLTYFSDPLKVLFLRLFFACFV